MSRLPEEYLDCYSVVHLVARNLDARGLEWLRDDSKMIELALKIRRERTVVR